MLPRSERQLFGATEQQNLYAADDVRRILERAAVEQHRRDSELDGAYSLEELEEMAAEAGISREALRAALEKPPRWSAALDRWIPVSWSPATKGIVLTGVAGVALFGLMLAFPVVAYAFIVVAIVLLIMMMLGVSPF